MKSLVVVLLATAALAFATAAAAFHYNGSYLVTFTAPSGPFQHCIELTETQLYLSEGYPRSGTWVDTDFPDTAGTWVVYSDVFHLAGPVDGSDILTIDGKVSANILKDATFDYFDSSGNYVAAGSVVIEEDASCAANPTLKGEFMPSGMNRLPVH
ncbi:MAG: hypothetical protein ABSH33_20385 [Steroidobacteraceae bacterium]|jgi:hypothetical protein